MPRGTTLIPELEAALRARLVDRSDAGPAVFLAEGGEPETRAALLREAGLGAQLGGIDVWSAQVPGDGLPFGEIPAMLGCIATHWRTAAPRPVAGPDEGARWRFFEAIAGVLAAAARRAPMLLTVDLHEPVAPDVPRLLRYLAHSLAPEPLAIVVAVARRPVALDELPGVSLGQPIERTRPPVANGARVVLGRSPGAGLEELASMGAFAAAVDLAEPWLRRSPGSPRTAALRLRLAEIARLGGDLEGAERLVRPLASGRGAMRARAFLLLGRIRAEAGRAAQAETAFRRALDLDESARELGSLLVEMGRAVEAEELLVEAIPEAAPAARPALRCVLAQARAARSPASADERPLQGVLKEARARGDRATESRALGALAEVHERRSEWRRQESTLREAREIAVEIGDVERAAGLGIRLSECRRRLGEQAGRLEALAAAARAMGAVGAAAGRVRASVALGHALLDVGLFGRAAAELHDARTRATRGGLSRETARALRLLALCDARGGDLALARRRLAQASKHTPADDAIEQDLRLDRIDVELLAGEIDEAAAAMRDVGSLAPGPRSWGFDARRAALQARLAARGPAAGRAEARARLVEAMGSSPPAPPPLLAQMHQGCWELAVAMDDRDSADRHCAAAVRLLDTMGAGLEGEAQRAWQTDPRWAAIRAAAARSAPATPVPSTQESIEERLFAVLEISRQLLAEPDAGRALDRALEVAADLTSAERGAIFVERAGVLRAEHLRGADGETFERDAATREWAERAFSGGEPLVGLLPTGSTASPGDDAIVCIPVRAAGHLLGVLALEGRLAHVGPVQLRILAALADQAGLALHHADLRAENAERALALDRAKREIERLTEERGGSPEAPGRERSRPARASLPAVQQGRFGMVGRSAAMLRVFAAIERVAPLDLPVLVEGESGTGKEMVARAIHARSRRSGGPMVSLNCAALPEGLLESELFGHQRGSFTGADRDREGLFVSAAGGTLFLDEIGDMSQRMQVDLLRVLQERKVRPVGANQDVEVDARVVAASQTPLQDLVKQGRFREDLFYRLHVVTIRIPALRERTEDIPPLVEHLLEAAAARAGAERRTVTPEAFGRLCAHPWPGNVRQLEHALTQAMVLCDREEIGEDDLALEGDSGRAAAVEPVPLSAAQRRAQERRRVLEALEACGWNRSRACKRLGIPRRTFYRRLREYGVL